MPSLLLVPSATPSLLIILSSTTPIAHQPPSSLIPTPQIPSPPLSPFIPPLHSPHLIPSPSTTNSLPSNVPPPSNRPHHMLTRLQTDSLKPKKILNLHAPTSTTDPASYLQALQSPKWYSAMSLEYQALQQ